MNSSEFPAILQNFFCEYLINQKNVSSCTVLSYRDTFRQLLNYAKSTLNKTPSDIIIADINAHLILNFLEHLETKRGNSIGTRNVRLAAIRSFVKYATLKMPNYLNDFKSILAIPKKRYNKTLVGFLTPEEVQAIIQSTNPSTRSGQRDRVLFSVLYNTGARVSEIIRLNVADVDIQRTKSVKLYGKGRKERTVPLWDETIILIKSWLKNTDLKENDPLFPNRTGTYMTRSGVESRLKECLKTAQKICPSLAKHKISPHTFRHTTAMHLLQAGVNLSVIALWLGHESISTTHMYMEADLTMKENALQKMQSPKTKKIRYRPSDKLLGFLESL